MPRNLSEKHPAVFLAYQEAFKAVVDHIHEGCVHCNERRVEQYRCETASVVFPQWQSARRDARAHLSELYCLHLLPTTALPGYDHHLRWTESYRVFVRWLEAKRYAKK